MDKLVTLKKLLGLLFFGAAVGILSMFSFGVKRDHSGAGVITFGTPIASADAPVVAESASGESVAADGGGGGSGESGSGCECSSSSC